MEGRVRLFNEKQGYGLSNRMIRTCLRMCMFTFLPSSAAASSR